MSTGISVGIHLAGGIPLDSTGIPLEIPNPDLEPPLVGNGALEVCPPLLSERGAPHMVCT